MHTREGKRTVRNLIIFAVAVLGSAILARAIEPFTVPSGAAPGTPGLGQLLWLVSPLAVVLRAIAFGTMRPQFTLAQCERTAYNPTPRAVESRLRHYSGALCPREL